jgi:hypothetical protein
VRRTIILVLFAILSVVPAASAQPHTLWYLPEGATGPAFEEHILIANPTSTAAAVRLTFLRPGGTSQIHNTTVEAFSRATVAVNALPGLAEGENSTIVESTNGVPIMVERTMYWIGGDRRGGHNAPGLTAPSTIWYFAEGSTGFFQTYLLLANQTTTPATVSVSFQREGGGRVDRVYTVQPTSRLTIGVHEMAEMNSVSFSTTISSSVPIFAERAMYWLGWAGGHDAAAIATPSTTWYFAEGFVDSDFRTYILLGNPNTTSTGVTVRFMKDVGGVVTKTYTIPPQARLTVPADAIPEINPGAFATTVDSTLPIVAERAMYWGGFQEGSAVTGEPALRPRWGFSEGAAGTIDGLFYESFFLFSNPSTSPISVTGYFYREDGSGTVYSVTVPAQGRFTLYGETVPRMSGQRFAAFFESSSSFLVERAMYWGAGRYGGHASAGVPWTGAIEAPPPLPKAPQPTIAPAGGTFTSEPTVQLTSSVAGALVRYTLDGSEPTEFSTPYSAPFAITQSGTLKAKTFATNYMPSATASAVFTLQVSAPSIQPAPGEYPANQAITLQAAPGVTIRYTTNGLEPSEFSLVYGGPLFFSQGQAVQLRAKGFRAGWSPSATSAANFTFTQGTLPIPTASPAPGIYDPGVTVTLSTNPFGPLYYTLDGTEPTPASIPYGIPFSINQPTTVRARAFASGFTPSPILTAQYRIRVVMPTMTPAGGSFSSVAVVTLSSTTPSATIRYTTDGNEPTETSTIASGQLQIQPGTILKARGYRTGWEPSAVVVGSFEDARPATGSPAIVQLGGAVNPSIPQAVGGTVQFTISSGTVDPASVQVDVNGVRRPAGTVGASGGLVTAVSALAEGRNVVEMVGVDPAGYLIQTSTTLWAGGRTLQVQLRTTANQPIAGGSVSALIDADPDVAATATSNGSGIASLPRLPVSETLRVFAEANGYRSKYLVVGPSVTSVQLVLEVDNNSFEAGDTRGWGVVSTVQGVYLHSEAPLPWVPCPTCIPREENNVQQVGEQAVGGGLGGPDYDLFISTRNSGLAQTAARSFVVSAGVRAVTVRYRFGTAEVFATQAAPDQFRVRLRSQSSGAEFNDIQNVPSLLPFLSNGVSAWRTITIPVAASDEVVLLEASVTNASDVSYESYIEVDSLQELQYTAAATLVEYHKAVGSPLMDPLEFLSVSPHSNWGNGTTRIRGTLTLTGPSTDGVANVELEILEGTVVRARAPLATAIRPSVVRAFGATGTIQIATAALLFELPSSDTSDIVQTTDGDVELRMRVTYTSGRAPLVHTVKKVQKLVQYSGPRFGSPDPGDCVLEVGDPWRPYPCGGDQWTRPSTRAIVANAAYANLSFNDFSNMNGATFPPHVSQEHKAGRGVDARFNSAALRARDAAMGQALIDLLNSTGNQILRIGVTFTPALAAFINAAPPLADNSLPRDRILNWREHTAHFHIHFR